MRREDLQKIDGLTKEQIDSIMGLHQSDVTDWQGKITTLQEDKTTLEGELVKFKGVDIDSLQTRIATLEQEKSTLENDKANLETQHGETISKLTLEKELDKVIYRSNSVDPVALKAHLNMDQISYDSETKMLNGFDEQLEAIKRECGYLFTPITTGLKHNSFEPGDTDIDLHGSLEEKYK